MREFTFTIRDELGLHARPAAELAELAAGFRDTEITIITRKGRKANASDLIKLMSLVIRYNDTVTIQCDGAEEKEATEKIQIFFEENL